MSISRNEVAKNCRVLGIYVLHNKKELKKARDFLAKIFHPDKFERNISDAAKKINHDRFVAIQNSYEYLVEHHEKIQKMFSHLDKAPLTSKGANKNLSHWVYTMISRYND